MNRLKLSIMVLLLAFCVSGCSAGEHSNTQEEKKEIVLNILWAPENDWIGLDEFLNLYKKEIGNDIEIQYYPAVEYDNIMRIKMSAGEGPDIFRTDSIEEAKISWPAEWFSDFKSERWTDRLTEKGKAALSDENGKLGQVPLTSANARGIVYNRKVLEDCGIEELPQTWDGFVEICERIKAKGYIPVNIQSASDHEFGTQQFICAGFMGLYDSRGTLEAIETMKKVSRRELLFSDIPEMQQSVDQLLELRDKKLINPDFLATTTDLTVERICNGKCAFTAGGGWIISMAGNKYDTSALGMMALPLGDSRGSIISSSGIGIAVNPNSENMEEAKEFIDLWCSREWQQKNIQYNPGESFFADVPSCRSSLSDDIDRINDEGYCRENITIYSKVFPDMGSRQQIRSLLNGEISSKEYMEELDRMAENIGRERKIPGW